MTATVPERIISALGSAMVLGLLGYLLVGGLGVTLPRAREETMALLDFPVQPAPKVRIRPPVIHKAARASPPPSGSTTARSDTSPPGVPAPPAVAVPSPAAPAVGPLAGSGGADGSGRGSGGGSGVDGDDAGEGGGDVPPRLITGDLDFSDLPADMRRRGVGATISVHYDVETDGMVGACRPSRSSGDAELDRRTCELIRKRFRFAPARDRDGRPIESAIDDDYSWTIDKVTEADQVLPAASRH